MADGEGAWLETWQSDGSQVLAPAGRWAIGDLFVVEKEIRAQAETATGAVIIDLSKVDALDTAGAWTIYRTAKNLQESGVAVDVGWTD